MTGSGQPSGDACDGVGAACRPDGARSPLPTIDPAAWDVRRRRSVRRAAAGRVVDRGSRRRVSVLILDVGGVVIPSLFESVSLPGFPEGPLASEQAWARVRRGETTERAYWLAVTEERPGLDVPALWRACSHVRDELRAALDTLAARVRLVAFTNDMTHFFGEDWPSRFPEMRSFDAIIEARALGVHKPDPEAFVAAAAAVGERPDRCLLVDDLDVNLDGAQRAGMHVRLFDVRDPAGSIQAVLDDLDLKGDDARRPRAFRPVPSTGALAPTTPRGAHLARTPSRDGGARTFVPITAARGAATPDRQDPS